MSVAKSDSPKTSTRLSRQSRRPAATKRTSLAIEVASKRLLDKPRAKVLTGEGPDSRTLMIEERYQLSFRQPVELSAGQHSAELARCEIPHRQFMDVPCSFVLGPDPHACGAFRRRVDSREQGDPPGQTLLALLQQTRLRISRVFRETSVTGHRAAPNCVQCRALARSMLTAPRCPQWFGGCRQRRASTRRGAHGGVSPSPFVDDAGIEPLRRRQHARHSRSPVPTRISFDPSFPDAESQRCTASRRCRKEPPPLDHKLFPTRARARLST